jgi:RNA polymerase primary sigma factor
LVELAREASRARGRADAARRTLLEAHLRLVIAEAKRFVGRGVPLADLVQEGNLGLLDAADRFDPELGYRFNTYAMWWIRAKLRGTVARNGRTIRVPVRRLQAVSRLQRAAREAATEFGREPTAAEVGRRLEISEEEVERLLALPAEPLRIEGMDAGGDGAPIADRLADPDAIDPLDALLQGSRDDLARHLMDVLSEREASIIRDRFGFRTMEHTLDEIGRKMGVTRERIRQIEARALKKMRVVAERGESGPAHGGVSDATG